MALTDIYTKTKKKVLDTAKSGLGKIANEFRSGQESVSRYFAPAPEKVRVRDVIREMPKATWETGKGMFQGSYNLVTKAPKILGEGAAYAFDPEVRKQYTAGNLDILPTISRTSPKQMLADTGRSALEVATLGRGPKIATSAKLLPRVAYGAGTGYGFDVLGSVADRDKIDKETFKPGMGTVAGGVFSGAAKPAAEIAKEGIDQVSRGVKNTKRIVSQVPTAVKNSLDIRTGRVPKEVIPEHWVPSRKISIRSDATGRPDVIPPAPTGERYTGPVKPAGIDPVTQSPRFAIQTEKLIPKQEVTRMKGPTISSLAKETLDLIPQPGMSIKAVKSKADEVIDAEVSVMKETKKGAGVSLMGDPESVSKTRVSSNPQWYSNFYKANGRKPNQKEMREMAKQSLERGSGYFSAEYREALSVPSVPTNKNTQAINAVNAKKNAAAADAVAAMRTAVPEKKVSADPVEAFKESLDEMAPNGGKPYNEYQKKAYGKKQERIKAITEISEAPRILRAMGYSKKEAERFGVREAKQISELGKLGYAKDDIKNMDFDRRNLILERGVKAETLRSYHARKNDLNTNLLDGVDPKELKDISPLQAGTRDVYRNFEDVFGGPENPVYKKIKSELLDRFDEAKAGFISDQNKWLTDFDTNVVKRLGITKGSKLSEAVQRYGDTDLPEGERLTLEKLKQEFPNDWEKVVEADKWFRNAYDTILDQTNRIREFYFPTHPLYPESTKVIPKRANYYRHFRELADGLSGLMNIFDTPASIDPSLAVSSEFTKPKTKWLSFAQKREGKQTEVDAAGGFLDYLKSAMYAQHIDPHIQRFRGVDMEVKSKLPRGEYFHETRGLAEELSQKVDPLKTIAESNAAGEIRKVLMDRGIREYDAKKMAADLEGINDIAGVTEYLKTNLTPEGFGEFNATALAEESGNKLNNFLKFVDNFANDLAGKTNPIDRPIQDNFLGRQAFRAINWANSRVKANTILGNASSAVAQFFGIPNGIANAGVVNSAKAIGPSLLGTLKDDVPAAQSTFLKERYFNGYDKFEPGVLARTKDFAVWLTSIGDKIGTTFTWNAQYQKALAEGIANPVKYADDWTRKMVAGRGIGEVPIAQKSKLIQIVAPFQLEVANQWRVFGDWAKNDPSKIALATKLVEYSVAVYIMNRIAKELRGSDVAFDPLNAIVDAYDRFNEEENKLKGAGLAVGRLAGEGLSNLPGGMTIAGMYPEYGKKDLMGTGIDLPTREDFFGDKDPTRFGGGLLASKAITDPLYMLIPPFGGRQIKNTIEGSTALNQGFAENNSGKVMTPVETTIPNVMKGVLMGKNSLDEVQSFRDQEATPLGDKQDEVFRTLPEGERGSYYQKVMDQRDANKEKDTLKAGGSTPRTEAAGALEPGMYKLKDGSIYVPGLSSDTKTFRNERDAKLAMDREDFVKSGESMRVVGNVVFRRGADGYIRAENKDAFDEQVLTQRMISSKKNEDFPGWKTYADQRYEVLKKLIQDPSVDDLERVQYENEMAALVVEYAKYRDYGGAFTKPKVGKKTAEKYRYPLIDRDMMRAEMAAKIGPVSGKVQLIPRQVSIRLPKLSRVRRIRK